MIKIRDQYGAESKPRDPRLAHDLILRLKDPKIYSRMVTLFDGEGVRMDTKLSKAELEDVLRGLSTLLGQGVRAFEVKRAEVANLASELGAINDTNKGLVASINAIKRELGLPVEDGKRAVVERSGAVAAELDATFEVMRIIAEHQEKGGIDIDSISNKLKESGITVSSRDYLHTILNRKKNKQKKLIRVDGKWFLTDKGKAEVKMRTE